VLNLRTGYESRHHARTDDREPPALLDRLPDHPRLIAMDYGR
jgi:hypothetical protein